MQIALRRILPAAGIIVLVAAVMIGATGAFFSDTETSTGNTFTAGAIDLQIDNTSYGFDYNDPSVSNPVGAFRENSFNTWQRSDLDGELFFNFVDLKPGDYGEDTISIHVDNNDAWACMALDLTGTPENGQNEPELGAPDTTLGANQGELQDYLYFTFWADDGDNVFEQGETPLPGLNNVLASSLQGVWQSVSLTPLPGATTRYIGKAWCFGTMAQNPVAPGDGTPITRGTGFTCSGAGAHNIAQTDGIRMDVGFYAEQSRNNPNFSCANLPPLGGGDEEPVPPTADLVLDTGPFTRDGSEQVVRLRGVRGENNLVNLEILFNGSSIGQRNGLQVDSFFDVFFAVELLPGGNQIRVVADPLPLDVGDSNDNRAEALVAAPAVAPEKIGVETNQVPIEMVQLNLTGVGPIVVNPPLPQLVPQLGSATITPGAGTNLQNGFTMGGNVKEPFAPDSFFDVFYVIDIAP